LNEVVELRISELVGKEVVDQNGKKLGKIKKLDIVIGVENGEVQSIILHRKRRGKKITVIPWSSIQDIGSKTVLIDDGIINWA